MKDEDRRELQEGFLGEVWHEIYKIDHNSNFKGYGERLETVDHNRTFDTWEDFGALWEALIEKGILGDFMKWLIRDSDCVAMAFVAWESWEPKERCIIILKAINEGVIK